MNLKLETTTELNVLQVAVDDIIEHLRDLPAHDDLEAADFAERLTAAKALKARLDTTPDAGVLPALRAIARRLDDLSYKMLDHTSAPELCGLVEDLQRLGCRMGGHDWVFDQCGFWQHQSCGECSEAKYPDMAAKRCGVLTAEMGGTTEEEFKRANVDVDSARDALDVPRLVVLFESPNHHENTDRKTTPTRAAGRHRIPKRGSAPSRKRER